jgi:subtilisin family serine protease
VRFLMWGLVGTALLAAAPATAAADDLIVRFKPTAAPAERAAAHALAGVSQSEALPLSDAFVVSTLPGIDAAGALAKLSAHPAVAYAEPDAKIKRHAVPNDQHFPQQWGLSLIGSPAAWDVTTGGAQVTVAVIDSGIDLQHPDLKPNLWTNSGERAGNNRDDDRNGYVDDVHGYDWTQHEGSPQDEDGHGSHSSGIVAAQGNDGVGTTGVAWKARLMALRVLTANGDGDVSDAIKAYGYALRNGARFINVSWGGDRFTRAERDMIADMPNVLVVASAGNTSESNDATPEYPCNHDLANIICVAASDRDDSLADFSNFGTGNVDLAAPGVEIASTITRGEYSYESGTSMAAPHVTGAAALLLARAGNASSLDIRRALLETVEPKPDMQGKVATGGRLNVANAVGAIGALAGQAAVAAPPPRVPVIADDRKRPSVRILRASPGHNLRRLVTRGLNAQIRCSEACALNVEIVASHSGSTLVLGRRRAALQRAGSVPVVVKLSARRRASARRAPFLRARLRVRATDPAGNVRTVTRSFRWRR